MADRGFFAEGVGGVNPNRLALLRMQGYMNENARDGVDYGNLGYDYETPEKAIAAYAGGDDLLQKVLTEMFKLPTGQKSMMMNAGNTEELYQNIADTNFSPGDLPYQRARKHINRK